MNLNEAKHRQQLNEWKERVMACRGSGMGVKVWCQQEGYSCKTYYRWERQILNLAGEQLARKELPAHIQPNSASAVFEEISLPEKSVRPNVAASVNIGQKYVEIYQGASPEFIAAIFRGLNDAE